MVQDKEQMTPRILVSHADSLEDNALVRLEGRAVLVEASRLRLQDVTASVDLGWTKPDGIAVGDWLRVTVRKAEGKLLVQDVAVLAKNRLGVQSLVSWFSRLHVQTQEKSRFLAERATAQQAMRTFFTQREYLEVSTPSLVPSPGCEPHLQSFQTVWQGGAKVWRVDCHLPTSPEFHLKKLLALGYERIFELSRSYRNEEASHLHQPEFFMLEWYKMHASLAELMDETEHLVAHVIEAVRGEARILRKGKAIDCRPPWPRVSVRELFETVLGLDPIALQDGNRLAQAAREKGLRDVAETDGFDDAYFKLFLNYIERRLGWKTPVFVTDYPACMSALAKLSPDDPRTCERFEVYVGGVELANAYHELLDHEDMARRLDRYDQEKRDMGMACFPRDPDFLDALAFGIPATSGIALGWDRLVMLACQAERIQDVLAFPHLPPESAHWPMHDLDDAPDDPLF